MRTSKLCCSIFFLVGHIDIDTVNFCWKHDWETPEKCQGWVTDGDKAKCRFQDYFAGRRFVILTCRERDKHLHHNEVCVQVPWQCSLNESWVNKGRNRNWFTADWKHVSTQLNMRTVLSLSLFLNIPKWWNASQNKCHSQRLHLHQSHLHAIQFFFYTYSTDFYGI